MPKQLYGIQTVAKVLGVSGQVVVNWRRRETATPSPPEPDYLAEGVPLWESKSLDKWQIWHRRYIKERQPSGTK